MPQNASGRLKTCLLPEPMLSDGLRTALNDNSCEIHDVFCYNAPLCFHINLLEKKMSENTPQQPVQAPVTSDKRIIAAVLAFFLGGLGVHKFYLGMNKVGIIYLLISILGSFIFVGPIIIFVFCIIDIVKYLKCTPEEFEQTYVIGKKEWF